MIHRHLSLRQAAKEAGIDRTTLRRLMEIEGFQFPEGGRNKKFFIPENELQRVLGTRGPQHVPFRLRKKSA
jgi:hypothetical protein